MTIETSGTVSAKDIATCFQDLSAGHTRYKQGLAEHHQDSKKDREKFADHQTPRICILACADSRVPPEIVFDQQIGHMFVLRVAGNFADDDNQASLEYAIQNFCPPPAIIVVLGHERCGAVKAAVETFDPDPKNSKPHRTHPSPRLKALVTRLKDAVEITKPPVSPTNKDEYEKRVDNAVRKNVEINVDKLKNNEVIQQSGAWVVGGRYDLDTGDIEWLTPTPNQLEIKLN